MFYPICTSLDRIQSFTLDLNWNESKRVHFGEQSQTGTDSGSVPVRIQQVQCRRKAYLYPYWYGSVWIRSSVNGVLGCKLWNGLPVEIKALELLHRLKGKLEDGMITATARYAENSLVMSVSLHNSIDLPSFYICMLALIFFFYLKM